MNSGISKSASLGKRSAELVLLLVLQILGLSAAPILLHCSINTALIHLTAHLTAFLCQAFPKPTSKSTHSTACVYLTLASFSGASGGRSILDSDSLLGVENITSTLGILHLGRRPFGNGQPGPIWRDARADVKEWLAPCDGASIWARLACI